MNPTSAQTIAILGAGESGVGAALLAKAKDQGVFVSEFGHLKPEVAAELTQAGIPFEAQGHTLTRLLAADIIIKSPGIPQTAPVVQALRQAGKPIVSEIEYAAAFTQGTLVAVTGTNGKTTTVRMIAGMLQEAGLDYQLCGNIGNSFARELAQSDHAGWVLEVSSFQLEDIQAFRPHIAVITNLSANHLNRYDGSLQAYADAKFNLLRNQQPTDHFVYCLDSPELLQALAETATPIRAARYGYSAQAPIVAATDDRPASVCAATSTHFHFNLNTSMGRKSTKTKTLALNAQRMNGLHNRYNAMASSIVGNLLQVRNDVVRDSLNQFENSAHRLESLGKIRDVHYVNDSKATNVNAAWFALEACDGPIVWMVGGVDKGNDYGMLLPLVKEKVKAIVMIGADTAKIEAAFSKDIKVMLRADNMEEAVTKAYQTAQSGDTVLLSPACASFDWFESYEDRGEEFRLQVLHLV